MPDPTLAALARITYLLNARMFSKLTAVVCSKVYTYDTAAVLVPNEANIV